MEMEAATPCIRLRLQHGIPTPCRLFENLGYIDRLLNLCMTSYEGRRSIYRISRRIRTRPNPQPDQVHPGCCTDGARPPMLATEAHLSKPCLSLLFTIVSIQPFDASSRSYQKSPSSIVVLLVIMPLGCRNPIALQLVSAQ